MTTYSPAAFGCMPPFSVSSQPIAARASSSLSLIFIRLSIVTARSVTPYIASRVDTLDETTRASSPLLFAPSATLANSNCCGLSIFMGSIIAFLTDTSTEKDGLSFIYVIQFLHAVRNDGQKKARRSSPLQAGFINTFTNGVKKMLTENNISYIKNSQAASLIASDFFVSEAGDAYISQRKAEEFLGLSDGTLRKHLSRHHKNVNTSNGLDAKLLQSVTTYYAFESRTTSRKAAEFLAQLAEAGAKAFIYRMAGYQIDAKPMQAPAPRELSRMDLIKLAMEAEQERLLLAAKVEEMQPTVAAYDRLTNAENTVTMTDAAKQLKLKPSQLREWMVTHKWIYKLGGAKAWTAHQDRIDSGCMMHKTTTVERDGETSIYSQARVTAKGLATISKAIEKARKTAMIVGVAA